jgi:autotransporter-associated beta strand protein
MPLTPTPRSPRTARVLALAVLTVASAAHAADIDWTNGSGDFNWNTSSLNWSTGAWNNAGVDGAIFGAAGVGTVNVNAPVVVDSLSFTVDGYTLAGTGPITFATGASTQTTGVVNVAGGLTRISTPLSSAVGFQKIGVGVLEISGANTFTGAIPLVANGKLSSNVLIGGTFGTIAGGTLRLGSASTLPGDARVSIGNGYLDLGGNDVEIDQLIFTNQGSNGPWNTTLNANRGVIGAGKLRVKGEINVIGVVSNAAGNAIASDVDLGGKDQIVRVGALSALSAHTTLMFNGSLSNGSLTKGIGITTSGVAGSIDGIALNGNNTYTGPTRINSGANVISGTNASKSVSIVGIPGAPNPDNGLSLLGANGSILGATTVRAVGGGILSIDNNRAVGTNGNNQPLIVAAQNNDRLNDAAVIEMRDGVFNYRGFAGAAASETFGSLNVTGGHAPVTLTPNGTGGTVTLNATGSVLLAPRSTLQIITAGTNTPGGTAKFFVGGSLPAADATGILDRVAGSADFLRYDATTGLTAITNYATDFSTPGTNVSIAAATSVGSASINALKRSGTHTLTIADGSTLSVASGMLLNATGTATYAGGTIDFGAKPGVIFNGFNTSNFQNALTGTAGLILPSGTVAFTATSKLSGLSGPMDVHSASVTLSSNDFLGPINVRRGSLTLGTSQTVAGMGPITLGVAENDVDFFSTAPSVELGAAGVNAVFNRDLVVDNGTQDSLGEKLTFSQMPRLSPLSNNTGSQTFNGDIVLKSPLNFQGGGGGGTGATFFNGDLSGTAMFMFANGRAVFGPSSHVSNAGGMQVGGSGGFTAQVTFQGTASGNGPYFLSNGNSNQLRYEAGSLTSGPIRVLDYTGLSGVPSLIALEDSVIANPIVLGGAIVGNPAAGVTATWAGPISGVGTLAKLGTGTLVLTSSLSTHLGDTLVDGGTLRVNGTLPSPSVFVRTGGRLEGSGAVTGVIDVASTGILAPGAGGIGGLATGSVTLAGLLAAEIAPTAGGADLLSVTGSVTLGGALELAISNLPAGFQAGTYLLIANDGLDPVSGVFSGVTALPAGFSVTIDYAFAGMDSLFRTGNGNDVAVTIVPEPTSLGLLAAMGLLMGRRRRR